LHSGRARRRAALHHAPAVARQHAAQVSPANAASPAGVERTMRDDQQGPGRSGARHGARVCERLRRQSATPGLQANVRSATASGCAFARFGFMKRRRVLVLAYLFPPLGGAGVQRTLKFVRYLEPLGWDATVVSTRSRHYPARDPSLLSEIPGSTRLIRTPAFPLLNWIGFAPHRLKMMRLFAYLTWPDGGIGW